MCFASSVTDILSFCPCGWRYILALSLYLYILTIGSVFCQRGTVQLFSHFMTGVSNKYGMVFLLLCLMLSLNVEKVLDGVSSLTSFLSWQLFNVLAYV